MTQGLQRYRRLILPLVLGLFALMGLGQAQELVILHDTHFHGKYGAEDEANIARYAALVKELKEGRDNVLFVGNGDDLAPSLLASVYRGEHVVGALNAMGLDFNTYGNHEFDYGPDSLVAMLERSTFRWVSGNIVDNRSGDVFGAEQGAARYLVHEMPSGLRVGVTGFAPPDTPEVTTLGAHAEMADLFESAREVVAGMRADGAQVVLVLSHLCAPDAERLAAEVDGIDAIVGDHCAGVLEEPEVVNGTIISRVGDEFDYLGELTLVVAGEEVVDWRFTLHEVSADIEPDPEVLAIVNSYEEELDAALAEPVGETTTPLEVRRAAVRSEETNLGNFVADVMREWAEADIGMQNGGSIRADRVIEPGPLTLRDVIETLPFENHVVKLEVTGETLLEMLELSVSSVEEGHGRFLQVSGLSFSYDPGAEPGSRVREVLVGGEPLEPGASYTLATNSFLATGGDGYEMLVGVPVLIDEHAGPLHADLVEEAIRVGSPIGPELEGRIRTVD
ncbi:MAG: 5'-nucleotidase C-terminal domain-containing protein [Deinococcota bacterium]|nr:5'-nucleotidase C-terminal domain-containing protein [Deinococcota bacterium]